MFSLFVSDFNQFAGANAYSDEPHVAARGRHAHPTKGRRMSDPNPQPRSRPARDPEPAADLTSEQITRWADRIADGRDEFPADLGEPDRSALADAVRVRLRDRLVRLVARAIAGRLARADAPDAQE